MQVRFIPVIGFGAFGTALVAYAYFASGTGVTGTIGALLALVGAVAVLLGGLIAAFSGLSGWLFGTLVFLMVLSAVLTALAGFFLMQYGLAVVMGLAALAVLGALILPSPQRIAIS